VVVCACACVCACVCVCVCVWVGVGVWECRCMRVVVGVDVGVNIFGSNMQSPELRASMMQTTNVRFYHKRVHNCKILPACDPTLTHTYKHMPHAHTCTHMHLFTCRQPMMWTTCA